MTDLPSHYRMWQQEMFFFFFLIQAVTEAGVVGKEERFHMEASSDGSACAPDVLQHQSH